MKKSLLTLRVTESLIVAQAYFVSIMAGELFLFWFGVALPFWMPSGIILAAVLLRGRRVWPGIFLGACISSMWLCLSADPLLKFSTIVFLGAVAGTGDVLAALAGAYIIQEIIGDKNPFRSSGHILKFIFYGVFVSVLISVTFKAFSLMIAGMIPISSFSHTWLTWWRQSFLGALIITPCIVTLLDKTRKYPLSRTLFEETVFFLLLTAVAAYCFQLFPLERYFRLSLFVLAPLFMWAVLRLNQNIIFLSLFLLAGIASVATASIHGPFVHSDMKVSMVEVQIFLVVAAVTVLLFDGFILEEQRIQMTLRESEEKFRALAENNRVGITRYDQALRFIYVNTAAIKGFNLPAECFIGKTIRELLGDCDIVDFWESCIQKVFDTKIHYDHEYHFQGRWFQWQLSPEFDCWGTVLSVIGSSIDITERKAAQEEIIRSEQRLKLLVENSQDIIVMQDLEGKYLYYNGSPVYGFKAEDVLNKTPYDLFDTLVAARIMLSLTQVVATRNVIAFEHDVLWSGKRMYFINQMYPIKNEAGEIVTVGTISRNIVELKEAEESLRLSEARFRALTSLSFAGVYLTDSRGKYLYVNQRWSQMCGLSFEEALGDGWMQRVHPDDLKKVKEKWEKMIRVDGNWSLEYRFLGEQGSVVTVMGHSEVLKDDAGNVLGYVGTTVDISERIAAEEKIKTALKEKELLLKEIHHRVKNNLQIISSLFNLQSKGIKNKKILSVFRESNNRVKSMALLHEKLYKAYDLGKVAFQDYVESLVTDLFRSYKINSSLIGLSLDIKDIFLSIDKSLPCGLIINELVSNALKYAFPEKRKGSIKVSFGLKANDAYELVISDDGVGFPMDIDFENTGSLGLQLVNSLVQQMNGSIVLTRNNGAIFCINFPRNSQ
ncbi:MAG: PAS domain S-box protein [Candidatus Omnitrophota bacterium]